MQLTGASGIGAWNNMLTPELVCSLHSRLFRESSEEERTLSDGSINQPGLQRSVTGQNVIVGMQMVVNHTAVQAVDADAKLPSHPSADARLPQLQSEQFQHRQWFARNQAG